MCKHFLSVCLQSHTCISVLRRKKIKATNCQFPKREEKTKQLRLRLLWGLARWASSFSSPQTPCKPSYSKEASSWRNGSKSLMTSSFNCKSDPKYLVGEGGITSKKKNGKENLVYVSWWKETCLGIVSSYNEPMKHKTNHICDTWFQVKFPSRNSNFRMFSMNCLK